MATASEARASLLLHEVNYILLGLYIYLGLWYLGEAKFCISHKGILHGVYRKTIEGSLCPNVFLKAFSDCPVQSARRKREQTLRNNKELTGRCPKQVRFLFGKL